MRVRVTIFVVFLLSASNVFADDNANFFQICDFREAYKDKGKWQWADLKECTSLPEGEDWKKRTVYVISGHSAKGLNKLPEELQAQAAMARVDKVSNILRSAGFSNIVILPLALEIGSKVLVMYTKTGIDVEKLKKEIENKFTELERRLSEVENKVSGAESTKYLPFFTYCSGGRCGSFLLDKGKGGDK